MAYDGGLCLGRGARTRALLLDAIRAGQVVLEDVRAARLAGLRMVGCDRLFLRSGEACSKLRKCVVSWSAHLWPRRAAFSCVRGAPPRPDAAPDLPQSWERAHHFGVVVRHYDCKNRPAKLFNHLSATKLRRRAPPVLREQGLDKDGGWRDRLVPCRTLALELCPQSIGRSPRLHSARQLSVRPARYSAVCAAAKLHWHSAA